jgi:hypothetical protein
LGLQASLYEMIQILSLTMFERIPLNQLLTLTMREGLPSESLNQLILFE